MYTHNQYIQEFLHRKAAKVAAQVQRNDFIVININVQTESTS